MQNFATFGGGSSAALYGAISLELTAENHCVVLRDSADHAFWLSPDDLIVFNGGKTWAEPAVELAHLEPAPVEMVKKRRTRRKRNPVTGELE